MPEVRSHLLIRTPVSLEGNLFFAAQVLIVTGLICFVFLIESSLVNYIFLKFIHFYFFFQLLAVGCGIPCWSRHCLWDIRGLKFSFLHLSVSPVGIYLVSFFKDPTSYHMIFPDVSLFSFPTDSAGTFHFLFLVLSVASVPSLLFYCESEPQLPCLHSFFLCNVNIYIQGHEFPSKHGFCCAL